MSSDDEVLAAIAALAAQGYTGVQLTFDTDRPWLSVRRDGSSDTAAAIAEIVLGVDPRSRKL